ncbi:hypothetical protein K438DRAFT_1973847 [Mycena galopus ATCC 62051]|nr:hypothetical protein K438DRAFT_1973847 [Mycena galopus ATCC 62051]
MKSTIDNTYGVLFLSIVISSVLYGGVLYQLSQGTHHKYQALAGVLQFWIYIRKYHAKDPLILTSLVSLVLVLDTCQLGLLCHGVSSITDAEIYISVVNSLMIEVFFGCAIATLVQQFYCWRIYMIGNRLLIAAVVSLLSLTSSGALIAYGVKAVQLKFLFQVIEMKTLSITSMTLMAVTDVAISVSMVIVLQASKTGYKRTTDLINRLMIFTFNTGLPPAISAILCTVTIILYPNTFLYILFFLLLGRLYTNSLLVTLNTRDYIRTANDDLEQYSLESSFAGRRGSRPLSKFTLPQDSGNGHIAIRMDEEQSKDFDSLPGNNNFGEQSPLSHRIHKECVLRVGHVDDCIMPELAISPGKGTDRPTAITG